MKEEIQVECPDCGCEMRYKKIGPGYTCGNGCSDREDN